MPGYLLDTCAWIDSLLAPEKLRQPIRRLIGSDTPLHLCSVSLIEFARKEARGEIINLTGGDRTSVGKAMGTAAAGQMDESD